MRFAQAFSLALLAASVTAHSQTRVNPHTQVQWPSCAVGDAYLPATNTCGIIGSGTGLPVGWTVTGTGASQLVVIPGIFTAGAFSGPHVTISPVSTATNWTLDTTTPTTAVQSMVPGMTPDGANGAGFTGTVQAPLRDKGGQVFNIKAYGAKGDGSTDDTAAILAAWTAAAAVGGTVFCPASATTYRISTLAITSAMTGTTFTGPQRSLATGKGCLLQATGTGYMISNAGDNPGSSHPAIFDLHISNINFTGNGTSFGAIYLDFANWPIIDHNNFYGFPTCALSGVTPVEPCAHIIKMGASQYGSFHDNIFTGNGYAIDAQWAYTSKPAAGAYGCNDCDFTKNIFSSSLGVRTSGDTTVEKNDFEISLQLPAVAQMDFSDATVNATGFYANYVNGNYSESTSPFPDAAHPAQATNVLVRCGNPCVGLNVKNNKRMYGNSYLGIGVWIDHDLYQLDISGNAFTYWEKPIYMTAGKGFPGNGGLVYIGNNNYGSGLYPKLGAVQPTLTLTLTSGALTNIALAGGTAGAYSGGSIPFVQFTGGNCTVTPTAQGVLTSGTVTSYTITRAGSGCDGTLAATSVGGFMAQEVTGNAFTTLNIATNTFIHQIPSIEWADDTGFHFDNRAVTFSPYALAAADTTLDLTMANLYELASGTLTISAVSNARPAQKFSIRNRAGTLTLTNSVFNLCSGADTAMPANSTWAFEVGTSSVVREVGCSSALQPTMIGQAVGSLWYSDGTKPASVQSTGFAKFNTSGVPTFFLPSGTGAKVATTTGTLTNTHCVNINAAGDLVDSGAACLVGSGGFFNVHLTGQTASIGNTAITTVGGARQCFVATSMLHTTTVGTSGTITSSFVATIDGSVGMNVGASNSVTATTVPANGGSLGLNVRYFCADAGTAVNYSTSSTAAGGYVYNLDVSLQAVP